MLLKPEKIDSYCEDLAGRMVIKKDSQAMLDYSLDLTRYLAKIGNDTVASFSVTNDPLLTQGVDEFAPSHDGVHLTVWLSGGGPPTEPDAAPLKVDFLFTTNGVNGGPPRTDSRSIYICMVDK